MLIVANAYGGLTKSGHDLALSRAEKAGAVLTSWIQVLLEFKRDLPVMPNTMQLGPSSWITEAAMAWPHEVR